jgi:biopolymer transport protein ExbD
MDEKPFETLNVVPLVDVMLVLLTMVLTTANFIATGRIPLALPQASKAQTDKEKHKTIEIGADGVLRFEGAAIVKEELPDKLAGLPPDTSFLVRADRAAVVQSFVDVADALKKLNFVKVALQTRIADKK